MTVTERLGGYLLGRTSRRGFLARATVGAAALSVAPIDLLARPGTAYAAICGCANADCDCSDLCCDGYTQFCCTINNGYNVCPVGTFAGGWWMADGSEYCAGPRYYIDCHGECQNCGCDDSFCPDCDGLTCECALGDCSNRRVGCNLFRYGQCNTQIACAGRISCRVVSCTPPWELGYDCSTASATDDTTADHYAPCQDGPTAYPPPPPPPPPLLSVGMGVTHTGDGYWLADSYGGIHPYGDAVSYGSLASDHLGSPIVAMAVTPTGAGYWLVAAHGGVFTFGDASFQGSLATEHLGSPIVAMAATPTGDGYWLAASGGGVFTFGDATFSGSMANKGLGSPIVAMAATPTGKGYWLVSSHGGVFTFGDAGFHGSLADESLGSPIVAMAVTPTGDGYWLMAAGGGVFTFGDAGFYGSMTGKGVATPIAAAARTTSGDGYWLNAAGGGVFSFGDALYYGKGV